MSILASHRSQFSRSKMLRLLGELETVASPAVSIYIAPGLSVPEINEMLGAISGLNEIPPNLPELVASSTTGAVLFWGEPHNYLVLPPFPIKGSRASNGYDVGPLRSLLQQEFRLALLLVRLGAYAIGVFQGEKRL